MNLRSNGSSNSSSAVAAIVVCLSLLFVTIGGYFTIKYLWQKGTGGGCGFVSDAVHIEIAKGKYNGKGCKSDSTEKCIITYTTESGVTEQFEVTQTMWEHLKEERAAVSNAWGPLFFDYNTMDHVIDVTLDVSASVINQNRDGAYAETQLAKLIKYLSNELNIKPGDTIRVHFLGQDEAKRVKEGLPDHLEISFRGPQFEYSKVYSEHRKTVYLSIKDHKFPDDTASINRETSKDAYRKSKIIELLSEYYRLAISKNISAGKTYIIENAIRTFDENQLHSIKSVVYLLLTDGEFDIEGQYVRKFGWPDYFSVNTYNAFTSIVNHLKNGDIKGKGGTLINLNISGDAYLILIGFVNSNNNDYMNADYEVFKALYSIDDINKIKFIP